jgi:hypothetical protein
MILFVCVGVMYSGEYDVCGVTMSMHPGKLKSLPDHQYLKGRGFDSHRDQANVGGPFYVKEAVNGKKKV